MPELFFLCFMGFCAGIIVAGGVSGLLIGLSIVPRYAGITHTAECIFLYEDMSLLGTVAGTVIFLFHIPLSLGPWFLALCGVSSASSWAAGSLHLQKLQKFSLYLSED